MRLNNIYQSVSQCSTGSGSIVCFWEDRWLPDVLSTKYPRLTSFARNRYASVQEIMVSMDLDTLFMLPLTHQAFEELIQLQEDIQNVRIEGNDKDTWCPSWGTFFTSKKIYSLVYNMVDAHPVHKVIQKSSCTPRVKFFIWLILVDRLNTKNMLTQRHIGVRENDQCIMCETDADEAAEHLFFSCRFARRCWAAIHFTWDSSLNIEDRIMQARSTNGFGFFTEAAMIFFEGNRGGDPYSNIINKLKRECTGENTYRGEGQKKKNCTKNSYKVVLIH